MNEKNFKEEDSKKVVEFLNFVAKRARFDGLNTLEIIDYFKLLNYMQSSIIPKIEANILEIKKIINPKKEPKAEKVSK